MSPVAESILDVAGVTPRIVADLGQVDFTIRHVRDDVADHYSEADLEEAYRLIMANQISGSRLVQFCGPVLTLRDACNVPPITDNPDLMAGVQNNSHTGSIT